MALDDYAALKAAVASWLARSDLTAQIPDFIALCEADFNRKLRILPMETAEDLTINAESVAQPTGMLGIRRLYIANGMERTDLEYVTPFKRVEMQGGSQTGLPRAFTIEGANLLFAPVPSGSYTGKILYWKALAALSGDDDTNWMLTNHPDVYLYGALAHSAPFIGDDARVATWANFYAQALDAVRAADRRDRASGPMTMRPGATP